MAILKIKVYRDLGKSQTNDLWSLNRKLFGLGNGGMDVPVWEVIQPISKKVVMLYEV
ncbi:MAG: hypothetical protein GX365_02985 [Clostridiales bacterium]|nr:hypothetical protein [Clostridiales bacterium]